jgi:acyl dehydratase
MQRAAEHLVVEDGTPGRLLTVSDLVVGDRVQQSVTFGPSLRQAFSQLAQDGAPVHGNASFARSRGYAAPILQGLCVTSRFSRLIGMYLPGEAAVVESLSFKFRKPVYQDATVIFEVEVERLQPAIRVARLRLSASVDGQPCIAGQAQCLLR